MNYLIIALSTFFGYIISRIGSQPNSKIFKKMPVLSFKFIQLTPNIKITIRGRTIWIHHWIYYSIILIITLTYNVGLLDSLIAKGYMTGAILHGLTFPDWRKIVLKKNG